MARLPNQTLVRLAVARPTALIVPLLLLGAASCSKRICPDEMELDRARSQPGHVAFCASRADRSRAAWIQLYENGLRRQLCPFIGGRPGGTFQSWHKNGSRWLEGRYQNGVKTGHWAQWSDDGHPVADGEYREGALVQGAPVGSPAACESVTW